MLGMRVHRGQKKYLLKAIFGFPELVKIFDDITDTRPEVIEMRLQVKEHLGIEPGDQGLIRRFLLSCANRWGKSAVVAILQLWTLFNKFGITAEGDSWFSIEYRTANVAPRADLTEPVFKAMQAIMTSAYPIKDKDGKMTTNKCQIEWFFQEDRTINSHPLKLFFTNNSYIEHLTLGNNQGDNLQGKPYGLITYDEAPRTDHLEMELDNSILGRLLDWTAPLHLLGTPDQNSASLLYYHDLYEEGLAGLNSSYTQEGSIYENDFMTDEQIREHERMLDGNPLKDQMLHGKFIFGNQNVFDTQEIMSAQDESLNGGIDYEDGHKYVIGVDTAVGSDEMVYTVIDSTEKPFRMVNHISCKGNSKSPQLHTDDFVRLVDKYRNGNNMDILIETWNGESMRFFDDLPPYIKAISLTYGSWQPSRIRTENKNPRQTKTKAIKKADLFVVTRKLLAAKEIKIPKDNYELSKQLSIYKEDDTKLPTDRVISFCLACWLAESNQTRNQTLQLIEM